MWGEENGVVGDCLSWLFLMEEDYGALLQHLPDGELVQQNCQRANSIQEESHCEMYWLIQSCLVLDAH